MAWHATKKASKLPSMDKRKILVFDTETTGLSSEIDEIIQITILDGNGSTLFDSFIKPKYHKSWIAAEKINHISPELVKDAPTFDEVRKRIQECFDGARLIVGYNVNFDINFVEKAGIIVSGQILDVMTAFASYRADVDGTFLGRCSLKVCAKYFGYSFKAHDASEDAHATLYCFNQLLADPRFTTYKKADRKALKVNAVPKKDVDFSVQFKTPRKLPTVIYGIFIILLGEGVYYYLFRTFLLPSSKFITEISAIIRHNPVLSLANSSLLLMGVGMLLLLLGIIKIIIKTPRWIVFKFKRILKIFG